MEHNTQNAPMLTFASEGEFSQWSSSTTIENRRNGKVLPTA